jgi:hypothetical protein
MDTIDLIDGAVVGGTAILLSKVVMSRSAWTLLSVRGAKGELLDRFVNAWTMSWMPVMTRSVEEAMGVVTFVGNQERVTVMHSRRVSHIHTLKKQQ